MALVFTVLLGLTSGILIYFVYYFARTGETQHTGMALLAGLCVALVCAVILLSFAISSFVVKRTGQIATTARDIMYTGDLSQRIHIESRWDDIGYMTGTLNQLLERIEELMRGVKQVSENISHDLRTPLTRLRNKIEILQKQTATPETQSLYDDLIHEADHILATFAALLRITSIETGRQRTQFQTLRLDLLLQDVFDFYEPLAEEKAIMLTHQLSEKTIKGDRDMLFQAFANIVDNAIKFTPAGGRIDITLDKNKVSVSDTGPGVPAAERARIFERFYRTDASRNTPGSGLGLSLVAAVINLHQAHIAVSDADPVTKQGLKVNVTFW